MFSPIETGRLLIRPFRSDDVDDLIERRNDPVVAKYQNWALPFTRADAERITAGLAEMDGPMDDEWWMAIVEEAATGDTLGDLAVHLSWQGRTAEVGYTFHSGQWGRGYAVESVSALIEYLYDDLGVTRVFGMIHPENIGSAMVLERCGLLFEGHTRSSFWVGDEASDEWLYGMTREDWQTWRDRPRRAPEAVSLVPITVESAWDVFRLKTHKSQEAFVAPMAASFADALFPEIVDGSQVEPWLRAVAADGELVGFVMLALTTKHHPEPFLWRLLIDRLHQRRGIGGRVLEVIADECLALGDRTLLASWGEGKGSPREFYIRHGFVPTGRIVDGETEGRRQL